MVVEKVGKRMRCLSMCRSRHLWGDRREGKQTKIVYVRGQEEETCERRGMKFGGRDKTHTRNIYKARPAGSFFGIIISSIYHRHDTHTHRKQVKETQKRREEERLFASQDEGGKEEEKRSR